MNCTRREFVNWLTLAGTTGLSGVRARTASAEPPPETPRLRLPAVAGICFAPQYIGEELLRAEGFTAVEYVRTPADASKLLVAGDADLSMNHGAPLVARLDAGDPLVLLAGIHPGCIEVFGTERVRTVRDLKGGRLSIPGEGSGRHVLFSAILASVGLDPRKDVEWQVHPTAVAMRLLAEQQIDAYLAAPPDAQEARARKLGRVLLNTTTDRPWSQYFCCMLAARREFVQKYPVATRRALRAILKANGVCALEPERVARHLTERGYAKEYDHALQAVRELPYARWREYDPADTVRFYALRLHEAGIVKANPQKILAEGTDWRFLNELKKELKG